MKHSTVLFALIAGVAIGCSPANTPTDGGTADKKDDTTVAKNDAPAVDTAEVEKPTDGGPGSVGTEPIKPTPEGGATGQPTNPNPPAAVGAVPNGGGQNGGGRQGGGGGRRGGLGFLVQNEQFKKELAITDEQVKKIQAALPKPPADGAPQVSPEERQKQREATEKKIFEVLTPAQEKRIKEIQLQMQGPRALSQPEVAKELGLSADQVKKIEAALEVPRPEGGQPGGAAQPSQEDRQKMMDQFRKAREAANTKALAILTPAQKTKWTAMLGKKFEFQMPQGGGGGGAGAASVPK